MVIHISDSSIDFKKAYLTSNPTKRYEGYMQTIARIIFMNIKDYQEKYEKERE